MPYSYQPKFAVGDRVRVKQGTTDFDYADMQLGGWAGTVIEVEADEYPTYLIRWGAETLTAIGGDYRARCAQDGLNYEEKWLEEDCVELDRGGHPMSNRTGNITAPLLSDKVQEDRIRSVFGLASDDPLPEVEEDSLLTYYERLMAGLRFPLLTDLRQMHPAQAVLRSVTVLGLVDKSRVNEADGIPCRVVSETGERELPLHELLGDPESPEGRLIEDYAHWFRSGR
jgi:hypothetical protein